jgi:hypothetical protein
MFKSFIQNIIRIKTRTLVATFAWGYASRGNSRARLKSVRVTGQETR